MAFPVIPLLAMLGGGYLGGQARQARAAEAQGQLSDLIGQAGFEGLGGSGLLSDPTDPTRQFQFATGLMNIPGMQGAGGSLLGQLFSQAQQQQQFDQQFGLKQLQGRQDLLAAQQAQQTAQRDFRLSERKRILSEEESLRGEYESNLGDFASQQRAFNAAVSGLQGGTGFDAVANVVNFMKTLDPRSVVTDREGDQVISAQGLFGSVAQQVNNAIKGKGFDDNARRQIAQTLLRQILPSYATAQRQREFFESQAGRQGLDPAAIFGGLGINFAEPALPPGLMGQTTTPGVNVVQPQDLPTDLQFVNPRGSGTGKKTRRGTR
jgi:hypothetical protein